MAEESEAWQVYGSPEEELKALMQQAADAWKCRSASPEYIEWRKRARKGLREVIDDWQAEHGAFTEEERAAARKLLESGSDGPGVVQIVDIGEAGVLPDVT